MKYFFNGSGIGFFTHTVEWDEESRDCRTVEEKDELVSALAEIDITPIIVAIEQPSAELLARCEGKKLNSYEECIAIVNGTLPKTEIEILRETVDTLLLASLEV